MRFERDFKLTIQVGADEIIIKPPLRVVFNGFRSGGGMGNSFDCKIYNLNEAKRLLLVKDAEKIEGQIKQTYFNMHFEAGYEGNLNTIFKGQIHTAGSTRNGADIITTINCISIGYDTRYSFTSATVDNKKPVDRILQDMTHTKKGKISPSIPKLLRPRVIVGNSLDQLRKMYPDYSVAIQHDALYIVADDEVVTVHIPLISASTGLIGTPYRESMRIIVESIINPDVVVYGLIELESGVQPHLNGEYRVETITYNGDNWSDDWNMELIAFNLTKPKQI